MVLCQDIQGLVKHQRQSLTLVVLTKEQAQFVFCAFVLG